VDLWELLRVIGRRWFVFLPLAALAVAASLTLSGRVDPEYSASGSIMLVGRLVTTDVPTEPQVVNPYGGSLPTTAQMLQLSMSGVSAKRALADAGLSTNYQVSVQARSPFMFVQATAASPGVAIETVNHVISLTERELVVRQDAAGAPENGRVGVEVIASAETAQSDAGGQKRTKLLVAGLGLAFAAAAAVLVEGATAARRQRRDGAVASAAGPTRPTVRAEATTIPSRAHPNGAPDADTPADGPLAPVLASVPSAPRR